MYENKYPNKVGKMIAVDVGLNIAISWRLVFYQSILACVYLTSQVLGEAMGTLLLTSYTWVMKLFPFLGPLSSEADARYYHERCHPTVNKTYPYYYLYRNILTGNMKKMLSKFPSCPFLYMVRLFPSTLLLCYVIALIS